MTRDSGELGWYGTDEKNLVIGLEVVSRTVIELEQGKRHQDFLILLEKLGGYWSHC